MICLAYAGLFFPIGISNATLIALLIFCIVKIKPREVLISIQENDLSKLFIVIYFLQIIGLLYTTDLSYGLFTLEKKITFLLIPIFVLPLLQKVEANTSTILGWFGIVTLASSAVLLAIAAVKWFAFNDQQAFYYEEIIIIHYVYYSIYFACGSLLLIDFVFDSWSKSKNGIAGICLLFAYSFLVLVIVASKTGIGAFCIASILLLYKRLPSKRIFAISILFFLLTAVLLFYFNSNIRDRFTEMNKNMSFLLKDDFRGSEVYVTDLTMRLIFWKISITQLWHDNLFVFGLGTGDAQEYMNAVYSLPQYQMNSYVNWDSHNEWVFTLIQLGFIGVLALAVLYGKYLIAAFRRNDLKFLYFLLVTGAFSMTESILESNKGIVFFVLLFTVFATTYRREKTLL